MFLAFSLVKLFLCFGYFSDVSLSVGWGFSLVVVSARNKWYQSISGSSWDRVLVPRALVVVWRRSCVDLGAVLGLFVGSCVDLRTTFGLLEKSDLVE